MKQRIISTLLFCLIGINFVFAQDARAILDKASDAFTKAGATTAKFTLNAKDIKSKNTYSQDGTVDMKGNKFKIEIPDAITWFDGKTQWIYIKDTEEVNISNPSGSELQAISPAILFSIYKKGYKLKYNGEKTVGGKVVQEVEMVAESKKNELKKIVVQIDKANNTFSQIVLYDNNNMENTLIIRSYKSNSSLTDDSFAFSKKEYPDAEIVDLR